MLCGGEARVQLGSLIWAATGHEAGRQARMHSSSFDGDGDDECGAAAGAAAHGGDDGGGGGDDDDAAAAAAAGYGAN